MKFYVISLFPEMIESAVQHGIVGQAVKSGRIAISLINPRSFTENVHHTVDDRPFGGGDGMVMIPQPLELAIQSIPALQIRDESTASLRRRVIHLSPRGRTLNESVVNELAEFDELVLISSRYGGVDQRFLNTYVDEEISIGDYVLSGGELGALVLIDAVGRKLPGVLGNEASVVEESFAGEVALLEHPQFTRPRVWENQVVPQELLSGNHARIREFQKALSVLVTLSKRAELLKTPQQAWDEEKLGLIGRRVFTSALNFVKTATDEEWQSCGLVMRSELLSQLEEILSYLPEKSRKRSRRRMDPLGESSSDRSGEGDDQAVSESDDNVKGKE